MTLCECGHKKSVHNQTEGCMYQYSPKADTDYKDRNGYCICTEFYRIEK